MARESKNSYGNSVYTLVVHCVQKVLWDPYSSLSSFVLKKHSLHYGAHLFMESYLQFWILDASAEAGALLVKAEAFQCL